MLSKHSAVFRDELGTLSETKAKIHVREGGSLKQGMSHTSARERATEHTVTPVQFSEWAAPIIPINGDICVCGDYISK